MDIVEDDIQKTPFPDNENINDLLHPYRTQNTSLNKTSSYIKKDD